LVNKSAERNVSPNACWKKAIIRTRDRYVGTSDIDDKVVVEGLLSIVHAH
jgi:hypothetical protein